MWATPRMRGRLGSVAARANSVLKADMAPHHPKICLRVILLVGSSGSMLFEPGAAALRIHDAAHALNSLVDFGRILETDRDRIHTAKIHGELHRGVAILRGGESALAAQLHTDDAHPLRMNFLGVRDYFLHVDRKSTRLNSSHTC